MNEIYRDICEKLDWSVTSDGDGNIELEKYSPAGEDFIITVGEERFVDNVKAYAASFDQGRAHRNVDFGTAQRDERRTLRQRAGGGCAGH